MKKSITTNDTIAFCHHLEQMIEIASRLTLSEKYDAAQAAFLATDAWRMMAVAVKFHWADGDRENARRAVVKFLDTIPQDYYDNRAMGLFLSETFMAFTGKAVKEA